MPLLPRLLLLAALSLPLLLLPAPQAAAQEEPAAPPPLPPGSQVLRLPSRAVVDGDTLRLEGLSRTVRLVGLDTEELLRDPEDAEAARRDFAAYAAGKRQDSPRPVKFGTPLGNRARDLAADLLADQAKVALVPDDPESLHGYYGRWLGHVLLDRDGDGTWETNLAEELIRAGMSPYQRKYGPCRLYHDAFRAAEAEARQALRGVWDPSPPPDRAHYLDYPERLAWWGEREAAIRQFRASCAGRPGFFELAREGDRKRLRQQVGQTVTLFGLLNEVHREAEPRFAVLSGSQHDDIRLVAYRRADWDQAVRPRRDDPEAAPAEGKDHVTLETLEGELVYARGTLAEDGDGLWIRLAEPAQVFLVPER